MAAEKRSKTDFVDWVKLPNYPVYSAPAMIPNAEYDYSILGLLRGSVVTPKSSYADTQAAETLLIVLKSEQFEKKGNTAVEYTSRISKDWFVNIMSACVQHNPKQYVWQHPDFDVFFKDCILRLIDVLNQQCFDEVFVRTGKSYCLSNGSGFMYNGDMLSGAFSGMVIVPHYSVDGGISIQVTVPNLMHNSQMGNFSDSMMVYTDKDMNLKIEINASAFRRNEAGPGYVALIRKSNFNVTRLDGTKPSPIQDQVYADLLSKKLVIPMTRLDFRLMGVGQNLLSTTEIAPMYSTARLSSRFTNLRR